MKRVKTHEQRNVDANDKMEVEHPSQALEEVVKSMKMKSTPPKVLIMFDHTDINSIVTASVASDIGALGDPGASVNQEVPHLHLKEDVTKTTAPRSHRVLSWYEERMTIASQKQGRLASAIVLKEGYVASLRSCLLHWAAITESTLQMLGRYHTEEDISRTLRRQEAILRFLKAEINCVEYRIEAYRPRENLAQSPTCIAEQ